MKTGKIDLHLLVIWLREPHTAHTPAVFSRSIEETLCILDSLFNTYMVSVCETKYRFLKMSKTKGTRRKDKTIYIEKRWTQSHELIVFLSYSGHQVVYKIP